MAALVQRFDHTGRENIVKTGQSTQHEISSSNYFATLEAAIECKSAAKVQLESVHSKTCIFCIGNICSAHHACVRRELPTRHCHTA